MKINKLLLAGLSLFMFNTAAFATGGFFCQEVEENTENIVADGGYIHAVTTWSFGNAIVGKAKLFDPGHTDIPLDMAQYKNDENELYYLSVMDLPDRGNGYEGQRVVELKSNKNNDYQAKGVLSIRYSKDDSYIENIPVLCDVE